MIRIHPEVAEAALRAMDERISRGVSDDPNLEPSAATLRDELDAAKRESRLYAIARLYVVKAANARRAFEDFSAAETLIVTDDGRVRIHAPEYQSNCFPITREQAESADWSIGAITYGDRELAPIPADEEEER